MKLLLAAAALAALPLTAGAVTVSLADDGTGFYYGTASQTGKTDVSFAFVVPTALENFTVEISGTGIISGATLSYSLNGGAPTPITTPFAYSFLVGDFGPGSYVVSYDFTGTPRIPVSLTATAYGDAPAEVPLPAAGALAAAGVIALGSLKARRKKA